MKTINNIRQNLFVMYNININIKNCKVFEGVKKIWNQTKTLK